MNKLHRHLIEKQSNKLRKALGNIQNSKKTYRFDKRREHEDLEDFILDRAGGIIIGASNNKRFMPVRDKLLSKSKSKQAFIYRELHVRDKFSLYENRRGMPWRRLYGNMLREKEAFAHYANNN